MSVGQAETHNVSLHKTIELNLAIIIAYLLIEFNDILL